MDIRLRVAKLLASGLTATQVASVVGLSPGRISQLTKEPGFDLLYQAEQVETEKTFSEETALDAKYLSTEHALLKTIEEQAPMADMQGAVAALRVITERQFKKKQAMAPVPTQGLVIQQVVQISLPRRSIPEVALSSDNEVTAINQQSLAPMSSTGVVSLFKRLRGENHDASAISSTATPVLEEAVPQTSLF